MKLNMPVRYFPGDVNTNIDLLKKKLLMARQDIVFEYYLPSGEYYLPSGEYLPSGKYYVTSGEWRNISGLQNDDGTWLTNENIQEYNINYIRMSFDKGLTWPLKLKVNAGFMETISFNANDIVDNTDISTSLIYPKVYTYSFASETVYSECVGNPVAISVDDGDSVYSLITSVRFYQNKMDILLTEEFANKYTGKTCYVKILKNEIATAFNLPVPIYSNMVNATPSVYDTNYGNVYYLNNTYKELEITSQLDNVNRIGIKAAVPTLTGSAAITLGFKNPINNIDYSEKEINVDSNFKWIDIPFVDTTTYIDGPLAIEILSGLEDEETLIIKNIRTQSV